jgi:hypothetical protein
MSLPTAPQLTASCGEGWIGYGDSCYKVATDKSTWWNAESKCQQLGTDSHLASCLSEKELFYLAYQQKSTSASFFVGISDM